MADPLGILLAVMEPSAEDEAEFHDWYDTEHVPERARLPGFLTAQRYVCIDGHPRFMALYDLDGLDTLKTEGYAAISGERLSPWSRRMLGLVHSRYSIEAEQVQPGTAVTGGLGRPSRLLLLRFRNTPAGAEPALTAGVQAAFGRGTLQARIFRTIAEWVTDHLVIVEANGALPAWNASVFGPAAAHLDLMNTYAPYWRLETRVAPARTAGS